MHTVARLVEQLKKDPFRSDVPFSKDLEHTTRLLQASDNEEESAANLSDWLTKCQPCLFGRITARLQGLSYCFLSEADLTESDHHIREKIQRARRRWRRKAFNGDASGFIILVVSEDISRALPDESMKALAQRICYLYLGRDSVDEILLEDVFLRIPGKEDGEIHWKAGVNYFCAQADQRWWHDHRIPGGMAFSVNSVGHLVKSFQLGRSSEEMWKRLGLSAQDWKDFKIDSLGAALRTAMQTINGAAATVSGKATHLVPLVRSGANPRRLECPVVLPSNLSDKDFCEYFGYYHTDFTLPSAYFRAEVERPREFSGQLLDFTYLFDQGIENPAFSEMGSGIMIRTSRRPDQSASELVLQKRKRMAGEEGLIAEYSELEQALAERDG